MQESRHSSGLRRLLGPSLVGVLLCVTCLVGSTLAWFQASQTASVSSIKTGSFHITATVTDGEGIINRDGTAYKLAAGKTYTVTLTRADDSTSQRGYVFFTYGDQRYTTAPFENSFTFTLVPDNNVTLRFTASFGVPTAETPTIASGATIGTTAADEAPTEATTLPPDTTVPSQDSVEDGTEAPNGENSDTEAIIDPSDATTAPEESTDAPTEPTEAPTEIPSESTVAPSEATDPAGESTDAGEQ